MKRIQQVPILVFAIGVFALGIHAEDGRAGDPKPKGAGDAAKLAAETPKASGKTGSAATTSKQRPVLYRPPKVGKPAASVGGGTRGRSDIDPVVYALVPDHVGQTASAQPSLFWFVDRELKAPMRVEFTLHADGEIEPAVESEIPVPIAPGIHRIRLSDHGVSLAPGIEYEWSVAVVFDADDPARDIVATGWIERVQPDDLSSELEARGRDEAVHVYAERGLWYDALTEVDVRIEGGSDPWISVRSELLDQVGLGVATAGI